MPTATPAAPRPKWQRFKARLYGLLLLALVPVLIALHIIHYTP